MDSIDRYKRNCTLVAVREVTQKPDDVILSEFRKRGYKGNHGTHPALYKDVVESLGFTTRPIQTNIPGRKSYAETNSWRGVGWRANPAAYMSLGQFTKTYDKGTFIVANSDHAWVVRDGIVVDPNMKYHGFMPKRRVKTAFEVIDAPYKAPPKMAVARNENPLVRFIGRPKRSIKSAAYAREWSALSYMNRGIERLDNILANSKYTKADATWDLKHGRLEIVKE